MASLTYVLEDDSPIFVRNGAPKIALRAPLFKCQTIVLALFITVVSAIPVWSADVRFRISGQDAELNEALTGASRSLEAGDVVQDIIAAAQADYSRFVAVLYDRGYFGPVINIAIDGREAADLSPVNAPAQINDVVISIQPGAAFRFGQAEIAPIAPNTELPTGFQGGSPATTGVIREAATAGIEGWRDRGYAKAELARQTITANHLTSRLDVDLDLAPGSQLRFGALSVSGNEAVRTDRIREIAGLPTGQVFSPTEAARVANRLRRTGTFRAVSLTEAERANPDESLDFNLQVTENAPRRFGVGAEISTEDGLTLSGFWLHRNLLGGAERLRLEAETSGIGGDTGGTDVELGARFDRPASFNEDTDFYISGALGKIDEEHYSAHQAQIETGTKRYASDNRTYEFGIGLRHAEITDAFGERDFTLVPFPARATFDYRDNDLNATDGYYLDAGFIPYLGVSGTKSGFRSLIDARAYRSVGQDDRLTFALRGQLGSVAGVDLADAPADYLFFSGGGGTVRGQPYQSLGVDLAGVGTVGGRSFLGLSAELRVKTGRENLSLVGFIDAGYIGTEAFPDGSSGEWHSGAGFGIRYDTTIGPIRLDIGVPVSGPDDNSGFEIYIGIGQAF